MTAVGGGRPAPDPTSAAICVTHTTVHRKDDTLPPECEELATAGVPVARSSHSGGSVSSFRCTVVCATQVAAEVGWVCGMYR